VGEVRGAEAVDMLLALTSGHRGSWATVHATSATNTIQRLASIMIRDSPQWSHQQATDLIMNAVDVVVHIQRQSNGRRGITEIMCLRNGSPVHFYGGS
jgi:pilus assembly protein CpaF